MIARKYLYVAGGLAMAAASAQLDARAIKVVTPLAAAEVGADQVTMVDVTVGDSARTIFDALETKAVAKLAASKTSAGSSDADPAMNAYATMPFAEMFPHVVHDEMTKYGLTSGRALRLSVQIDSLKTADAGVAMLLGSSDELAGDVAIFDAATGEKMGEYYIDVVNMRAGLLGLAMRGSGVREKLAAEFAKHVREVLAGKKRPVAGA